MNDTNNPEEKDEETTKPSASNEVQIAPGQTIIQSSEDAWITGTRVLQENLINGLQEYQTGFYKLRETALLSQKRKEMISIVTDEYIRFLHAEAQITSDTALLARKAVLSKQFLELKASLNKKIAKLAGVSSIEIEKIMDENLSKMKNEEIRRKYTEFAMKKIFELFEISLDQK